MIKNDEWCLIPLDGEASGLWIGNLFINMGLQMEGPQSSKGTRIFRQIANVLGCTLVTHWLHLCLLMSIRGKNQYRNASIPAKKTRLGEHHNSIGLVCSPFWDTRVTQPPWISWLQLLVNTGWLFIIVLAWYWWWRWPRLFILMSHQLVAIGKTATYHWQRS